MRRCNHCRAVCRSWSTVCSSFEIFVIVGCETRAFVITRKMAILSQVVGKRPFVGRWFGDVAVFFVAPLGQRAALSGGGVQELRFALGTHRFDLSYEDGVIAARIFGDDTGVDEGQYAVQNGRAGRGDM